MWAVTFTLLAVSLAVQYMTHREVYFQMDDNWYSTMLFDDTPIASFRDVVVSQIWHYNNWGGRSMTHGILQLTLLAGEKAADILNMAVTLLLCGSICLVAQHRNLPAFFAASGMILGLNANWKMSMFWQSGAANYLYITVFLLLFAFCYLREVPEKPPDAGGESAVGPFGMGNSLGEGAGLPRRLPGITLWIIPLGILAGWSNENMGPAMWVLSLAVILLALREKRKVQPWMVLGNLACLFGSVMVLAAPGNMVRKAQVVNNRGLLWKVYLQSYSESRGALEYLFPTLLILALVLILVRSIPGLRVGRRNLLLLFCALLSWGAFFLSPHYPDRASFGTMSLIICVILSLAEKIVRQRRELAWPLWGAAVLVWLRGMYFCCEYLGICWGWIR